MYHAAPAFPRLIVAGAIAMVLLVGCGEEREAPPPRADWTAHAELGPGFLVWESNRTGRWRIWERQLGGAGLRQLSPDEKRRDHYAPHISPDGEHVVYLSYPDDMNAYQKRRDGVRTPLRLHHRASGSDRVLAPQARSYHEDRAAVWIDHRSLVYIGGDGSTRRIDIHTGEEEALLPPRSSRDAYLIDPTLGHATTGKPAWAVYDAQHRIVLDAARERGCQPYFSRDGRWGYWIQRGGGPLMRIDLRSSEREQLLARGDQRLPADFGYTYFPMLGATQDLLAFGASGNEHDHFRADYEVFVMPVDPDTLEPTGFPLRYTFDPGTDRFPDVFRPGAELGRFRGEAPMKLSLAVPEPFAGQSWQWNLGDGSTAEGGTVDHAWATPGKFQVEARSGDRVLGAVVRVEEPAPPRPVDVRVRQSGLEVTVHFDERISADRARAVFDPWGPAASVDLGPDGASLRIVPPERIRDLGELRLEGVLDRADPPHEMPPTTLAVEPQDWPRRSEGLVFVWETSEQANRVRDPITNRDVTFPLEGRGQARLNRHFGMDVAGGAFHSSKFRELAWRARESGAFSLELTLTPEAVPAPAPATIVAYSDSPTRRRFALRQEAAELVFYLTTAQSPRAGERFVIASLPDASTRHVTVTVGDGRIRAFLDGDRVFQRRHDALDFEVWKDSDLQFGSERGDDHDWRGTLEGIALYDRILPRREVRRNALAYENIRAERSEINTEYVRARRIAASAAPTLEEILPYRDALTIHEYEVIEVLEGDLGDPRIRVAHWALLNGEGHHRATGPVGEVLDLEIELLEDHPQVRDIWTADDLPLDLDEPVYLEPSS